MAENIARTDSGQAGPCGGNGWRRLMKPALLPPNCWVHADRSAELNTSGSMVSHEHNREREFSGTEL